MSMRAVHRWQQKKRGGGEKGWRNSKTSLHWFALIILFPGAQCYISYTCSGRLFHEAWRFPSKVEEKSVEKNHRSALSSSRVLLLHTPIPMYIPTLSLCVPAKSPSPSACLCVRARVCACERAITCLVVVVVVLLGFFTSAEVQEAKNAGVEKINIFTISRSDASERARGKVAMLPLSEHSPLVPLIIFVLLTLGLVFVYANRIILF